MSLLSTFGLMTLSRLFICYLQIFISELMVRISSPLVVHSKFLQFYLYSLGISIYFQNGNHCIILILIPLILFCFFWVQIKVVLA